MLAKPATQGLTSCGPAQLCWGLTCCIPEVFEEAGPALQLLVASGSHRGARIPGSWCQAPVTALVLQAWLLLRFLPGQGLQRGGLGALIPPAHPRGPGSDPAGLPVGAFGCTACLQSPAFMLHKSLPVARAACLLD